LLDAAATKDMTRIQHTRLDGFTRGLLRTNLGPMLFSSRPILTSQDGGPIAGTLIMGQLLDSSRMERLRERTEVEMSWQLVTPQQVNLLRIGLGLDAGTPASMQHLATPDSITSFGVLNDLFGQPLLMLEVMRHATCRHLAARLSMLHSFSRSPASWYRSLQLLLSNTVCCRLKGSPDTSRGFVASNLSRTMNSNSSDNRRTGKNSTS
jgi:hypothetical protein